MWVVGLVPYMQWRGWMFKNPSRLMRVSRGAKDVCFEAEGKLFLDAIFEGWWIWMCVSAWTSAHISRGTSLDIGAMLGVRQGRLYRLLGQHVVRSKESLEHGSVSMIEREQQAYLVWDDTNGWGEHISISKSSTWSRRFFQFKRNSYSTRGCTWS